MWFLKIAILNKLRGRPGREALMRTLLVPATLAFLGGAAVAQAQSGDPDTSQGASGGSQAGAIEEITVTGSRIRRSAEFDMLQPATQLDSSFIDNRGFANLGDAISEIPSFGLGTNNKGDNEFNSIGSQFANAFGLGTARTLVLINGRRVVSQNAATTVANEGDPGLQVDLNIIPTGLIDRVETVYTGGAPVYGTDGIAGTVNVLLKDDYEGTEFDTQYGISQDGEAENWRFRGLWGANTADGRGNATIALEYTNVEPVRSRDVDVVRRETGYCENPDPNTAAFTPCDDAFTFFSFPDPGMPHLIADGDRTTPDLIRANGDGTLRDAAGNPLMFDVDGSLITWDEAGLGTPRNIVYSVGANPFENPRFSSENTTNAFINPVERWIINATGHHEIAENTRLIAEGLFSRTEATEIVTQPRGMTDLFGIRQARPSLNINIDENPFVTQELRDALIQNGAYTPGLVDANGDPVDQYFKIARSNLDVSGDNPVSRTQDVFRMVTGLEGDFELGGRGFRWDATVTFGKSESTITRPDLDAERFAVAVDAVRDPNTGEPVCRVQVEGLETGFDNTQPGSGNNTLISECVPFNPIGFNPTTPEQNAYLIQPSNRVAINKQTVYEANVIGDNLFDLPAGPLSLAAGFAKREEEASFTNDRSAIQGLGQDAPVNNVSGEFDTTEFYAETVVPIINGGEGLPFRVPFIHSFDFEGAIRSVDNSVAGTDDTWTAGARMTLDLPGIGTGLLLRGNFTQAIRAPAIAELFLPQVEGRNQASDPCDPRFIGGGSSPATRAANCQAEVDALIAAGELPSDFDLDNFNSIIVSLSQPVISGGNPNLESETTDSWSIGFVLRSPDFLPGLEWSFDWTSIEIENAIVSLGSTQILNACYDSSGFPGSPACNAVQRTSGFQVESLQTGFVNAARREFEGAVSNISYRFDLADLPFLGDAPGTMTVFGSVFHIATQEQEIGKGDLTDFAGERFNEDWRWQFNAQYEYNRFMALWQTRYTGEYEIDVQAPRGLRSPSTIDGWDVHNLTLGYRITDNLNARLVINNLFDTTDGSARRAAATAGDLFKKFEFHDAIGRRFTLGLNMTL